MVDGFRQVFGLTRAAVSEPPMQRPRRCYRVAVVTALGIASGWSTICPAQPANRPRGPLSNWPSGSPPCPGESLVPRRTAAATKSWCWTACFCRPIALPSDAWRRPRKCLARAAMARPCDFWVRCWKIPKISSSSPTADEPVYRSLKAEAGRLIATLPAEGRESYELQFGARARQMLKQAVERGNVAELADLSRQFFFTQAGQEATFLIGRHHLDQNRPLAAALCFERLRESVSARRAPGAGAVAFAWPPVGCGRASPTRPRRRWCV